MIPTSLSLDMLAISDRLPADLPKESAPLPDCELLSNSSMAARSTTGVCAFFESGSKLKVSRSGTVALLPVLLTGAKILLLINCLLTVDGPLPDMLAAIVDQQEEDTLHWTTLQSRLPLNSVDRGRTKPGPLLRLSVALLSEVWYGEEKLIGL